MRAHARMTPYCCASNDRSAPRSFDQPASDRYDGFMGRVHTLAELRRYPRAHLRLPARVRWQDPLGTRIEITETLDVSRGGVLVRSREEPVAVLSRAWIIFPFDSANGAASQPETPARVVRVVTDAAGGHRVAMRLEPLRPSIGIAPAKTERRVSPRVALCLPIFVRPDGMPWPEETMTRDFSRTGVRFETSRIYTPGETVQSRVPWGERASAGEVSGRVVRVEPPEHDRTATGDLSAGITPFASVAVEWMDRAADSARAKKDALHEAGAKRPRRVMRTAPRITI